jgi:lipopolysaccharide transport system permease protein
VRASKARVFAQFFFRDIKNRYLGSVTGLAWVFVQPLLLLALYTFLIAGVLKARIPGLTSEQWLPFVALGLWPWMCFSESLQRATSAVVEHAALLGKVALPAELLVAASVCATFALHAVGLLAILLLLWAFGYSLQLAGLPLLLLLLALLLLLTQGLAWIAAGLQVYLRDVGQILGQLLGFGFFLTPILYTEAMMPESIKFLFQINPLSYYCENARALLMPGFAGSAHSSAAAIAIALSVLVFGYWMFRRLARHFEDFL